MKRLVLLLATLSACHITTPQNPPGPSDAAPPPSAPPSSAPSADASSPAPAPAPMDAGKLDAAPRMTSRCDRAWARITGLRCTVKAPKTGTWTQACENAEQNGVSMKTACVTAAASCTAIKACLGEH